MYRLIPYRGPYAVQFLVPRQSPLGIATDLGQQVYTPRRPDWIWGPPSLVSNRDRVECPLDSSGQSLIKHHTVEMYGGLEVQLQVFLTSSLDRMDKWWVQAQAAFSHRIRWKGGWVKLRADLHAVER
jgi:hypothetical protein